MSEAAIGELVRRSLGDAAVAPFEERVRAQADAVADAIAAGAFDNADFTVGLELEAYTVEPAGRLVPVPDAVFEHANKELGVHNVEFNTEPTRFRPAGVTAQREALTASIRGARSAVAEGDRVVLDGMWTVPPAEGTRPYLGAVETTDGLTVASNMRESARYYALDRDILARTDGPRSLELPGVTLECPSIMPEALATSMQPHLQVPDPAAFPRYFNAAIRTLGPVLALGTNSPFLPADLYGSCEDPKAVVDRAHHESRIAVFEQSINTEVPGKVRVPEDIDRPSDVATRLVSDATRAPFLREWVTDEPRNGFADEIWELTHKRGTYWRWVRGVIGGDPVEDAAGPRSLRIEYRPVPTQPTVPDTVAFQGFVAGLLHGLVIADHPVAELSWSAARDCFYRAVERGLDADPAWILADGERTDDRSRVFPDLFEHARIGLRDRGFSVGGIDALVGPIEARWERRLTPSRWRKDRVRTHLDAGCSLRTAIERSQTEYIDLAAPDRPFAEWPAPGAV